MINITRTMKTIEILEEIQRLVENLNKSNSNLDKVAVLQKYTDNENIKKILYYTYNTLIQYNVTSASLKKLNNLTAITNLDLFELLDKLQKRQITGHSAIAVINGFISNYPKYTELIYNIIDKDLKIRVAIKTINKVFNNLIPEFSVSLCNKYQDKKSKVNFINQTWYASRKLDGCRCVVIIDENGKVTAWSRQGKQFETLNNLLKEIESLNYRNIVFDGELCIVDENGDEDFKSIMHEIKRKNYTINTPCYQIFDVTTLQEFENQSTNDNFSTRTNNLTKLLDRPLTYIKQVKQVKIENKEHFNELKKLAAENNWEGLVIRKDDNVICKRSDSLLKVKDFIDDEYKVLDVECGVFRIIENGKEVEQEVLSNIIIEHKGTKVSVGSGFSLEDRKYYYNHPNELIGKTVTVQYFEETYNDKGEISLRFPTIKYIYKSDRDL